MSKIFKDEKIFNKFKNKFKFIFNDQHLLLNEPEHFDQKGALVAFSLAFLQNRIGDDIVHKNVLINKEDWIDCFNILYTDKSIIQANLTIRLNPIVALEKIENNFSCFNNFIDNFLMLVEEQGWNLNISDNDVRKLLTACFGYYMYNSIECKLSRYVSELLEDPKYDEKYLIVLNNTKLFAKAKQNILSLCQEKINDLIVILLGGSNHLALDK